MPGDEPRRMQYFKLPTQEIFTSTPADCCPSIILKQCFGQKQKYYYYYTAVYCPIIYTVLRVMLWPTLKTLAGQRFRRMTAVEIYFDIIFFYYPGKIIDLILLPGDQIKSSKKVIHFNYNSTFAIIFWNGMDCCSNLP